MVTSAPCTVGGRLHSADYRVFVEQVSYFFRSDAEHLWYEPYDEDQVVRSALMGDLGVIKRERLRCWFPGSGGGKPVVHQHNYTEHQRHEYGDAVVLPLARLMHENPAPVPQNIDCASCDRAPCVLDLFGTGA